MLTLQELVADNAERINFKWIAGEQAAAQAITNNLGRAGADLVGHLNLIHPSRVQVLGAEELAYYTNFDAQRRLRLLEELQAGGVPAILIAEGLQAPDGLRDFCEANAIPLLGTHIDAAQLIDLLRIYLGKRLAPKTLMHGVFLDVLGVGVLITGESGLGKSELALELISRGHGLVADDAVELSRIAPSISRLFSRGTAGSSIA